MTSIGSAITLHLINMADVRGKYYTSPRAAETDDRRRRMQARIYKKQVRVHLDDDEVLRDIDLEVPEVLPEILPDVQADPTPDYLDRLDVIEALSSAGVFFGYRHQQLWCTILS
jgi:hypothetical protein